MRILTAMVLALSVAACASNRYPGEPASAHDQERTDEAVFIMTIDAGRMGIFVDRINSAAELLETPALGGDELIGVARSVRIAALQFLLAKEQLCRDAKFVEQSCARVTPPRWLAQDPSSRVTVAQVEARIVEVQKLDVAAGRCRLRLRKGQERRRLVLLGGVGAWRAPSTTRGSGTASPANMPPMRSRTWRAMSARLKPRGAF